MTTRPHFDADVVRQPEETNRAASYLESTEPRGPCGCCLVFQTEDTGTLRTQYTHAPITNGAESFEDYMRQFMSSEVRYKDFRKTVVQNFTPRARTHSSTGTSCSAQLVCCGGYGALPTNQLNKTTFMAVGGAFSPPPSVLRIHSCLPCSIASSRKRPCSPPEAMNTVLSRDVQPTQDTMQSTLCFVFTILDFKLLFTLSTRSPFNAEQSFSAPILPPSSSGFHGT
jgi:hypothetical protein